MNFTGTIRVSSAGDEGRQFSTEFAEHTSFSRYGALQKASV